MDDVPALFGRVLVCVVRAQDIRAMAASSRRNAAVAESARLGAAPMSAEVFQTLEGRFLESADGLDESAAAWDVLATLYNARMMSLVRSILRERTSSRPGPCGFRK